MTLRSVQNHLNNVFGSVQFLVTDTSTSASVQNEIVENPLRKFVYTTHNESVYLSDEYGRYEYRHFVMRVCDSFMFVRVEFFVSHGSNLIKFQFLDKKNLKFQELYWCVICLAFVYCCCAQGFDNKILRRQD